MRSRGRYRGMTARILMLAGAAALVVAVFLPWDGDGRLAIDLSLRSPGQQPTVGLVLVVLATIAALPGLVTASAVSSGLSGSLTAVLVVVWVRLGPDGALASGVLTALGAAGILLIAAALAPGRDERVARPARPHDGHRTGAGGPGSNVLDL